MSESVAFTPDQYEKLGQFYLGSGYDGDAKKTIDDDLVLYPSKDLVTHGVVLGMTGSGKTGLCMALLEEAAMDDIPALMIDPKGDIANLLLTFPDLKPADFRPWINEDDARRKNQTPDAFAEAQAKMWKEGLESWGQGADRIAALRQKVDLRIYTPGSNAGLPLSILSSLNAPPQNILDDSELLHDRVANTVSSILGLLKQKSSAESPEGVFLSQIFLTCWERRENVDMQSLIRLVLRPPFERLGQLNIEDVLPRNDREKLAKALNNLIASPGFSSWLTGAPLDIQSLLYSPEGKPQATILSIAHLSDEERMFFVTLVLSELTTWMRAQSGTTSLRALFYMDEIFGYLPPIANPPSKKPMLLLLKQARAFGLGLLLATQNPVDLDYKALSNIGTWWLGRLQTQRDKDRVLDGLEGAASQQNTAFDRKRIDRMLSELSNRVFLMNNVHAGSPKLMHVRWVMSYLRGPLTRDQIRVLTDPIREHVMKHAMKASQLLGATMVIPRPVIPQGVPEKFLPRRASSKNAQIYEPHLLRAATYVVSSAKAGVRESRDVAWLTPFSRRTGEPEWSESQALDCELNQLEDLPEDGIEFQELPKSISRNFFTSQRSEFINEIYTKESLDVFYCEALKHFSKPGESESEFRQRLIPELNQLKAQAAEKLQSEFRDWEMKWIPQYEKIKEDNRRRWFSWIGKIFRPLVVLFTVALPTVIKVISGQKISARDMSSLAGNRRATTASRQILTSKVAQGRGKSEKVLLAERSARESKLEEDLEALDKKFEVNNLKLTIEKVQPYKKDIEIKLVGLIWVAV